MKYCSECGRKLKDDAEFCFVCGAPLPIDDRTEYQERKEDFREERARIRRKEAGSAAGTIGYAFLLALLLAAMFAVWYSPARRTYMYAVNGHAEEATSLYESGVRSSTLQAFLLRVLVPRGASSVVDAYNGGNLAYTDAKGRLDQLSEFEKPLNNAARQAEKLEELYLSSKSFDEAAVFEAEGDARSAMLAYRMVGKSDSRYEEAVNKAQEMEGLYKAEVIKLAGSPSTKAEYDRASAVLENALELLPGDVMLTDRLTTMRQTFAAKIKAQTIPTASDYISKGYYRQAIDLVNEALEYNSQDLELKTLLQTATRDYEDFARGQTSIYIANNDKKGAVAFLDRVSADLPDSKVIQQLYDTVR